MATLYLSYFGGVKDGIAAQPISTQALTTSTTSSETGSFPAGAKVVRLFSSIEHYITEGATADSNTAAVTNSFYLPANTLYDVAINHLMGGREFGVKSFT